MLLTRTNILNRTAGALVALASLAVFSGSIVWADDRDLLRESSSDPLVFILFDTSGSMHWTPQCTQAQFDAGICDFLCDSGDCVPSTDGDDPSSKFVQAKEALFEVISQVEGINFGFATYNQDRLRMRDKHWLYRVNKTTTKPDGTPNYVTLSNGDRFPDIARRCTQDYTASCSIDADCGPQGGTCEYEDVFGAGWTCDQGSGINERGCYGSTSDVADMNDTWELRRVQAFSKLGRGPDFSTIPTGEIRDNFNSNSFSNNDGSINWAGSWIENDHPGGAGPTNGNARIQNGRLRLDDTPNESGRPSLARQANLTSFSTGAELVFDWQIVGDVENDDEVRLEISSNGGGNWTTLERFRNYSNPTSGSRTYDISGFVSANTRIRFALANQYRGSDEQFRVDNLEIRPLNQETVVYLRNPADSRRYKMIYRPVATYFDGTTNVPNRYGNSTFAVELEVRLCTNNNDNCATSFVDKQVIHYDLVREFAAWDSGADRGPDEGGFFNQSSAADGEASNTCDGWDDNGDAGSDPYPSSSGYRLRWPVDPDPPPLRFDTDGDGVKDLEDFMEGDVIPLDWLDDHKDEILGRLAPNTIGDPTAIPDFTVAPYFQDERLPGESFLRLKDESRRPLVSDGSTPLGNSIRDFRTWYTGCASGSCSGSTGWEDIAALFDQDFNCRKKFLMVLTDGDNTCSGASACSGTASLLAQTGIKTFVVAFGVQGGSGNTLTCMAANGGTGDPIYPQNKQELVDALTDLFSDIKVESRAFASASVPTVQNETSDRIFLSFFTPLPDVSVWPGRLNAFRKPLPLKDDNTPDFDRDCQANNLQAACHLWDAAAELRDNQAPTAVDISNDDYKVGLAANERRVFYSKDNPTDKVPADMRLFLPPAPDSGGNPSPDEVDIWLGLGLIDEPSQAATLAASARSDTEAIIDETLVIKEVTVPDPAGGPDLEFDYVMGDIFHADPRVLGSPNNVIYFRQDLNGYQEFTDKHFWRRKMLVVGANDGQLHFFDAGVRTVATNTELGINVERFTDGTGRELFSYIPRLVMPIVRDQALDTKHVYSLDGVPTTADVFIDPKSDPLGVDPVDPDDREWRTVLVSGLREAGDIFRSSIDVPDFVSGYFALDITQPDELVFPAPTPENPNPRPFPKPGPQPPGGDPGALPNTSPPLVPSCIALDGEDQRGAATCTTEASEPYPFPAELWTFNDSIQVDVDNDGIDETFYFDEEDNDERDLGDTWSKPVIGKILVCGGLLCDPTVEPNDIEERFVAVVGGGLDRRAPNTSLRGSFVYFLDIETGEAIYKRQVLGAVAATPAIIDIDRDGNFDVIYVGTTQGRLYKIDLTTRTALGEIPGFNPVTIPQDGLIPKDASKSVPTSVTVDRITSTAWEPFAIFDTGSRPIYMTPTTFLVPSLDQYAISFGTGNRFNLWDFDGQEGRLYTIVDENYDPVTNSGILPRTEANYALVEPTGANVNTSFLTDRGPNERGWFIRLEADEKIITQTFALVGVLVFTAFDPQESVDQDGDGFVDACARTGVSRAFVVDAENANAFIDLDNDTGDLDRFHLQGDFTTSPYIDETATKNPGATGKTTDSDLSPQQEELQEAIRQALMRFFPKGCRYNKSYSLTINASRSDTGHVRYATIPIAMCAVDWREE